MPQRPLYFDRVMEGRPPASDAPLFKLPPEILDIILMSIEWETLKILTYVNSDGRQLARSRLFASVGLDYELKLHSLVRQLVFERIQRVGPGAQDRALHSGISATSWKKPALSACIRRLTVATKPGWINRRHLPSYGESDDRGNEDAQAVTRDEVNQASNPLSTQYMKSVEELFSDRQGLRNLEMLEWDKSIAMPHSFFEGLTKTSIQHLKLVRIAVDEEFTIGQGEAPLPLGSWPLRSLHMAINLRITRLGGFSTYPLTASILRRCATTLETLHMDGWKYSQGEPIYDPPPNDPPLRFPRLRDLNIGIQAHVEEPLLQALISDKLQSLTICMANHPTFWVHRDTIPSLSALVIRGTKSHPLTFLRANTHLQELAFLRPQSPTWLENDLLPLLKKSFHHLTSLSLPFDSESISIDALNSICALHSLQQLHLSAGAQYGTRYNWTPDHAVIRKYLTPLRSLRKVAFSRDTYGKVLEYTTQGGERVRTNSYYITAIEGRWVGTEWLVKSFERGHERDMRWEVGEYVGVFPQLAWMFLGQLQFEIRDYERVVEGGEFMSREDDWETEEEEEDEDDDDEKGANEKGEHNDDDNEEETSERKPRPKIVWIISRKREDSYVLMREIFGGGLD